MCFIRFIIIYFSFTYFNILLQILKGKYFSIMNLCLLLFVRNKCIKQSSFRNILFSFRFQAYNINPIRVLSDSNDSKKGKLLSSTTIIMEDDLSMTELPCIVQIVNGDFNFTNNSIQNGKKLLGMTLDCNTVPRKMFKNIDFKEEPETILGFMRCSTLQEVFNLLNMCPESEITPSVALCVLKRIFDFENNYKFRNKGFDVEPDNLNFTFARSALLKRLIETICKSSEAQTIVDTLQILGRDMIKKELSDYLQPICNECAVLASEGHLTPIQICEIIKGFSNLGEFGKNFIDKVWVGINEKQGNLTADEVCSIVEILPLVKSSRMYLYKVVERAFPFILHNLGSDQIIKILYIFVQLKLYSRNLLGQIARWTNLNIHRINEGNLRWIVHSFLTLKYTDHNIEQALSRYMRARKKLIADYSLVSIILDYSKSMRIRNTSILQTAADLYIEHHKNLSANHICSLISTFGHLVYNPENSQKLFGIVENSIENNFSQFLPSDILDTFISCIYLQKYPLNFTKKIFNTYFFDQLHTQRESNLIACKKKLQLLDAVLVLESPGYFGPILPASYSLKDFTPDLRITRCMNRLNSTLIRITGHANCLSYSVILPSLPALNTFVIDCAIDTSKSKNLMKIFKREKYALIVALPDDYDLTGNYLLGPLTLKKRIIKKFGYKVVVLQYQTLNSLSVYPNRLMSYIQEEMTKA